MTQYAVIGIGASTGGPPAVRNLLEELSPLIPIPVLLVQHIYPGFAPGLVEWLTNKTKWNVKLLSSNTKAQAGVVYMCENGFQMGINSDGYIIVEQCNDSLRPCPSVSHMFSSIVQSYGGKSIGIILSGMGQDGVEELKLMKVKGGLTIAQDQKSSTVFGMPGEAAKINAAEYQLAPGAAARMLNSVFGMNKNVSDSKTVEGD